VKKKWILDASRASKRGYVVCLRQVLELDNGISILTGSRTPPMAFDFMQGDYDSMGERLALSLNVMVAEAVTQRDEEELAVAGEIAERFKEYLREDADV